jgi:pyruvate/2-oxoglutarate/acetoin dehydrogenase E1 component
VTRDAAVAGRLSYMDAVIEGIAQEMRRDKRIVLLGQDVGAFEGPLKSTAGLIKEFGCDRIRETPISESAMVGVAIGAAVFGMRPIVEIGFGEFLPGAMNQLINQAPNIHYMTGGAACVPVVVRTRVGDGPYGGHPQDYTSWFAHVPGLKVVMPACAHDAKGLIISAIRDCNPVLFVEPMSLVHAGRSAVPEEPFTVELGTARVVRVGRSVTVAALGSMVPVAMRAASQLEAEGVDSEVVDLRSLQPWDVPTVVSSVRKTGALVTVEESWIAMGFGAEVAATIAELALDDLMAPIVRVGTASVPVPSGPLRKFVLPNVESIVRAVRRVMLSMGRLG